MRKKRRSRRDRGKRRRRRNTRENYKKKQESLFDFHPQSQSPPLHPSGSQYSLFGGQHCSTFYTFTYINVRIEKSLVLFTSKATLYMSLSNLVFFVVVHCFQDMCRSASFPFISEHSVQLCTFYLSIPLMMSIQVVSNFLLFNDSMNILVHVSLNMCTVSLVYTSASGIAGLQGISRAFNSS